MSSPPSWLSWSLPPVISHLPLIVLPIKAVLLVSSVGPSTFCLSTGWLFSLSSWCLRLLLLPCCSGWQPLPVGWVNESKSKSHGRRLPAHLPETLGLIREDLAENLPNCRKLWRPAAGQITPWEGGRQDGVCCRTVANVRNEAASSDVEGGVEVKCLHVQTRAKNKHNPTSKWYLQFTSLVFVLLKYSESKTKQSQFCDYAIQRLF